MTKSKKLKIITYRVTEETWSRIEKEAAKTGATPNEWGRSATLEKLDSSFGLTRSDRILFEQFARSQYLVTQGFQLLAEDKLTPEQWKKFRNFANEHVDELADRALRTIHAGKAPGESGG